MLVVVAKSGHTITMYTHAHLLAHVGDAILQRVRSPTVHSRAHIRGWRGLGEVLGGKAVWCLHVL